jgi:hypothetical protein
MKRIAMLAAGVAVFGLACGGNGGTSGAPGVDRGKSVSAASDADKSSLCDWFVPMVGGYGAAATCPDWLIGAPADKADCTSNFPVCNVTVGQLEDCMVAIVAAQNVCTQQALIAVQARPDCQAVITGNCFGTP